MSSEPVSSWKHKISSEPGAQFPPEKGRYHLYAGLFCPFAQRALILLKLKGIGEDVISTSIVHWYRGDIDEKGVYPGWHFATPEEAEKESPGSTSDHLYGARYLSEIYFKAEPRYKGKYSVPVLWDKKTETIVNNESDQIMRLLSTAFDKFIPEDRRNKTYFPKELAPKISEIEKWVQSEVNIGVYKAGFSTSQEQYETQVTKVFERLDELEALLHANGGPFLLGPKLTDLDVRLYTTLIRFDNVYYTLFRTNIRGIHDGYPGLYLWLRRLYHLVPAFHDTTDFLHIKRSYFLSMRNLNPAGVVPRGPVPDIADLPADARNNWSDDGWKGTAEIAAAA